MTNNEPEPFLAEMVVNQRALPQPSSPLLARFSNDLQSLSQTHLLGAATDHQRIVYALVAETLIAYRADRILLIVSYLVIPFAMAFGVLLGFAVTAGLGWLLSLLGLGDVLVVIVAALVGLVGWSLRGSATDADIDLLDSQGKIQQLKLGRLEAAFQITEPTILGIFFGVIWGMQHALLVFTPSHLGLAINGNLAECGLLTLDNVCHGVFLDTFELYDLHWGDKLQHTYYSATVFYAFRLAFDTFGFLIGYALWRRYQLQRFFRDFPRSQRDVPGVFAWITTRCSDQKKWPQRFHDEFLFLLLCREFIAGRYDFVRQLSSHLPCLQVKPAVRDLFRTEEGTVVFVGSHSG